MPPTTAAASQACLPGMSLATCHARVPREHYMSANFPVMITEMLIPCPCAHTISHLSPCICGPQCIAIFSILGYQQRSLQLGVHLAFWIPRNHGG